MRFEIKHIEQKETEEPVKAYLVKSGDRLDLVFECGNDAIHTVCVNLCGTISINNGCSNQLKKMGFQIDPKTGGPVITFM